MLKDPVYFSPNNALKVKAKDDLIVMQGDNAKRLSVKFRYRMVLVLLMFYYDLVITVISLILFPFTFNISI